MIAVSSPLFSMIPFEEILNKIAKYFECWEIIAEGMHYLPDIKEKVESLLPSYDLSLFIHAPFSDLNFASLNPVIREISIKQIVETMRVATSLGITLVCIHPGHKSPLGAYYPKKASEFNRTGLEILEGEAENLGITLALENMPKFWGTLCTTSEEMAQLIENTSIKICFDVGHANTAGQINEFLQMKRKFADLHLHDNFGKVDRHLVLGKGNIDFKKFLSELEGYEGPYVIESMSLEEGVESKKILEEMMG